MKHATVSALLLLLALAGPGLGGCGLAAVGVTGVVTAVAVNTGGDDADPPPAPKPEPQPEGPEDGAIWAEPASATVPAGSTLQVFVYVCARDDVVGSYSLEGSYNQAAFTLQSVAKGTTALPDPVVTDTATAGSFFVSGMNQAAPDAAAHGVQQILVLTFQATGASGAGLDLTGQLRNLADTHFPAENIGEAALPRDMTVSLSPAIE